ncbi:phosphatase PAP2 family protein [Mucilaginibacter puniceus]
MIKRLFICLILLTGIYKVSAQSLDIRLLQQINGPISPADQTWRNITNSAYIVDTSIPVGMLITGLATHNDQLTENALKTGSAILLTAGFNATIKSLTNRQRPYLAYPDLITGKANLSDNSFPSGHTSMAFATATSLSLSFPKWYVIIPSYTYAAAIGYSRMYLGVHYPTDVLAGALLGTGTAFLTWKLQKILFKKNKKVFVAPN